MQLEWENAALHGFYTYGIYNGQNRMFAMKNDPAVLQTIFR